MERKDVSLDIEACGDVVMSIGAVEFDRHTGELGAEFYAVLDMGAQVRAGLAMKPEPFLWWLKQGDEARKAITGHRPQSPVDVMNALGSFNGPACVWAYPTSFDLSAIARMADAFGQRVPWKWQRNMDGRTLWQLAVAVDVNAGNVENEYAGVAHNALDDAKQQAAWYVHYLRVLDTARPK